MDSQGREAMDQVEPQPLPGQPERPPAPPSRAAPSLTARSRSGLLACRTRPPRRCGPGPPGRGGRHPRGEPQADSGLTIDLAHPVVVGYDGSGSSRHALAYGAGMARRLGRPLLLAYITSPSIFCEPLSGQVIAPIRDSDETHRWLLAELDEVCDRDGLDVRIVTRQGSPARELPPPPTSSARTRWSSGPRRASGITSRARCRAGWPGTRTARSSWCPERSHPPGTDPRPGPQIRARAAGRSGR